MRIAFLGKGGAGKTTTAAGFTRYVAEHRPFVLALDADVNAHMASALNVSGAMHELGKLIDPVHTYLKGKRTDLGDKPMIMTTPPSMQSNFVRVHPQDLLIQRYALRQDNIALLSVGRYAQADVGAACYHSKLAGAVNILHHLLDGPEDIVISDNTAGTDVVATSLWFAYDMYVFVVEPTLKSIQVYRDYLTTLPQLTERVFVVANKVVDKTDKKFLRKHIPADRLLGMVPASKHLRHFEQGDTSALAKFQAEQAPVFNSVFSTLKQQKRNWTLYLTLLRQTHARLCRDWYDTYYGVKLDEGLDGTFSYEAVAAANAL
jgi:CO dehydrogenase maturation factor